MAGVSILQNGVPTRIGFVPQHRLFVTGGEWVMDGLKVAVEYSAAGGTSRVGHGSFGLIQLNF